jgi:hypothetical protein
MIRVSVAGAVLVLVLPAAGAGLVEAGEARVFGGGPSFNVQSSWAGSPPRFVPGQWRQSRQEQGAPSVTPPRSVAQPQMIQAPPTAAPAPWPSRSGRQFHRFHDSPHHPFVHRDRFVLFVPTPVYIAPSRCYLPGHWSYQWVPQSYASNVWVPGQWSPGGAWIEGHYEAQLQYSGYYQPYWVEGSYGAC